MTSDNLSEAWNCFKYKGMSIVNNIASAKECRIKQGTQPSIKERDSAFHNFQIHK